MKVQVALFINNWRYCKENDEQQLTCGIYPSHGDDAEKLEFYRSKYPQFDFRLK